MAAVLLTLLFAPAQAQEISPHAHRDTTGVA